jgi:cytochrome P450 family 4
MWKIYENSVIIRNVQKYLTFLSPTTWILLLITIIPIIWYNKKRSRLNALVAKIPGPPALPFLGNAIEINFEYEEVFARITAMTKLFGKKDGISKAWIGSVPYVILSKPAAVEPILSSSKHIDKSSDYDFLRPWLGTGLLTSFGKKWHSRRKILTPAFHFKILDDFIGVFHEQSLILGDKLAAEIGNDSFNIFTYVTFCTLDIVCETAMGRQINAQLNSESEYVKAVYEMGAIILKRQVKFWLHPDWIFRCTKYYQNHQKCLKILHEASNKVIRERKAELQQQNLKESLRNHMEGEKNLNEEDLKHSYVDGKKKRLAFLDLLIAASQDGKLLSDEDIREEVDTFMFEGHDTTSAGISWCLFLLGSHPEYQTKCVQEILDVLGPDTTKQATMQELSELKYLECCIKESLRLYPSVPIFARRINEDVNVGKYKVPAGATAMIVTYMLHRNPDIYEHPEKFDPDRFLPENSYNRHPYAYIPFSAGPRNCIGQKFAVLEEKVILSNILRRYEIEAVDRRENLTILGELVLRPKNGLHIKISPRRLKQE